MQSLKVNFYLTFSTALSQLPCRQQHCFCHRRRCQDCVRSLSSSQRKPSEGSGEGKPSQRHPIKSSKRKQDTMPDNPATPTGNRAQTAGSPRGRGAESARSRASAREGRSRFPSGRHNKLYRGPPTPPPEVQYDRERSFVLDCKAVSHISNDYSTANPKLGSVIPPYNSQTDPHTGNYFRFFGVKNTLAKTDQLVNHESTIGRAHDRFFTGGHGARYLLRRNQFGAGHSIDEVRGHDLFLSDPQSVYNYNGRFGFRRNTPALRRKPAIGVEIIDVNSIIPGGRFSVVGCGNSYAYNCRCRFDQPCRCNNQESLCRCVQA